MRTLLRVALIDLLCYGIASQVLFAQTPSGSVVNSTSPTESGATRKIALFTQFSPEKDFHVGEIVTFEVIVRWLDLGENLSTRLAEAPRLENFDFLSSSTRSSSHSTNEGRLMEEVYSFRLVPRKEGPARVGQVDVIYGPAGAEKEEEARLSSVPLDVTIGPAKPSASRFLWPVGGAAGVFGLVGVGVWLVRRRSHVQQPLKPEPQPVNPAEEALEEAQRWRMEGDVGRYYSCLERAVGKGLAGRFSYREPRLVSARDLRDDVDPDTRRLVESFFSRCAEAKYAPGAPPREELDRIWEDAKRLLSMSTFPQQRGEKTTMS